jgi:hypothetical protein
MNYKNNTFAFVRDKEEGGFQVDCWHHSNANNECHVVTRHATTEQEVDQIKRKHYKREPVEYLLTWNSKEGDLLPCRDGKWRSRVLFGSQKGCLKTWKSLGWAERYARSRYLKKYTITYLYEGDEVSPTGEVTRKS